MTTFGPVPISVWITAARPKTLWAGIAPVIVGSAMAFESGQFHAFAALCALLGSILIQIGTNYANDYFDFIKGADQSDRLGPVRVTQAGLVSPARMWKVTRLVFLAACIPGLYLVFRGGWPVVVIGLVSIGCGLWYTAGPAPLGYIGLADLFVLIFFGPVALGGTYYVQTLRINFAVLLVGIAAGLFSVAILTVNNLRDIDQDRRAGKRTLAVRYGRDFARKQYVWALLGGSVIVPILLVLTMGKYGALSAMITMAAAAPTLYTVFYETEGEALNAALAQTGRLLLLWSVLFSIGWNL